jgi:hypothetical protein
MCVTLLPVVATISTKAHSQHTQHIAHTCMSDEEPTHLRRGTHGGPGLTHTAHSHSLHGQKGLEQSVGRSVALRPCGPDARQTRSPGRSNKSPGSTWHTQHIVYEYIHSHLVPNWVATTTCGVHACVCRGCVRCVWLASADVA